MFNVDYQGFVTIQINTALKLNAETAMAKQCFVTIQINTALKPGNVVNQLKLRFCNHSNQHSSKTIPLVTVKKQSFVTIQINTALKPKR